MPKKSKIDIKIENLECLIAVLTASNTPDELKANLKKAGLRK